MMISETVQHVNKLVYLQRLLVNVMIIKFLAYGIIHLCVNVQLVRNLC
jgi:hypothetical protein